MLTKPKTVDDYLRSLSPDRRATLERLRRTIRTILPRVEECISYSMPAFRLDGQVVAGFLATKMGCSYFPFSGKTLATLDAELGSYDQTKGALRFDAKLPLSAALVRKLLKTRVAERAVQAAKKPAR